MEGEFGFWLNMHAYLRVSCQDNVDELVAECQTILGSTAVRDGRGGGGDSWRNEASPVIFI